MDSHSDIKIDKTFVQAVATVKSLKDLSKTTNLPRPSITARLDLYGLYSQSTRGDANPVDPAFSSSPAELKKHEAWVQFKGLSKAQARKQYAKYLLNILKNSYPAVAYPAVDPLRTNLQEAYNQLDRVETFGMTNVALHNMTSTKLLNTPVKSSIAVSTAPTTTTSDPVVAAANNHTIPPRAHSPAASLYRIASSGINATIIRPPSRHQSFSKSRQNSVSGTSNTISNAKPNNTSGNSLALHQIATYNNSGIGDNYAANSSTSYSNNIGSSLEFLKWQGEINNTLLKISTELSNLKVQQQLPTYDAGHRTISGSTMISVAHAEIPDYKLRNKSGFDEIITSFKNQSRFPSYINDPTAAHGATFSDHNGDPGASHDGLFRLLYKKLLLLLRYLKGKVSIRMKLASFPSTALSSLLMFILFGLLKRIFHTYLKGRYSTVFLGLAKDRGVLHTFRMWLLATIGISKSINHI